MKHDLTIFPEDWILRIWWAEFGPGKAALKPRGGHWILLIRMSTEKDGPGLVRWIREEAVRESGETEWKRTISLSSEPAMDQIEFGKNRRQALEDLTGAATGRIHVGAGGGVLRFLLERGATLPKWITLLIIERRAASPNPAAT